MMCTPLSQFWKKTSVRLFELNGIENSLITFPLSVSPLLVLSVSTAANFILAWAGGEHLLVPVLLTPLALYCQHFHLNDRLLALWPIPDWNNQGVPRSVTCIAGAGLDTCILPFILDENNLSARCDLEIKEYCFSSTHQVNGMSSY